ncbi:MAG: ribbon-helix-helix domain-containing protein [Bryobacterales bacterium]|nr:ribbon-helix-helix domain-containing protein [Bryobacterales bacterium]
MRVTMNFDDELLRRLKKRKAKLGLTVTAQVQDAVRMYLANCEEAPRPETDLPVFHGSGVLPGIDLNNSAALLDVMEGLGDSD